MSGCEGSDCILKKTRNQKNVLLVFVATDAISTTLMWPLFPA